MYVYMYIVALIAQWLERELRRRRSWVQSSPHQTERVRDQSTQSLWRISCPPPEQTPRTCREDPLGQKEKRRIKCMCTCICLYKYIYIYIYTHTHIIPIYIYIYIYIGITLHTHRGLPRRRPHRLCSPGPPAWQRTTVDYGLNMVIYIYIYICIHYSTKVYIL